VVGVTHNGVLIQTSTTAPDRAVAAGSHRLTLTVDGTASSPATLESLPVGDGTTAPAGTSPVIERMPRSAGRTGLLIWLHRPDPATPVQVSLHLTDPRGRSVERQLTVPPWIEPQPGLVITVDDAFQVAGRGWVFTVSTSADPDVDPTFGLHVLARQPLRPLPFPSLPGRPPLPPGFGGSSGRGPGERDRLGRILDLWPATTMTADFLLVDIPRRSGRPIPGRIEALRLPDTPRGVQLQLWIPLPRLSRVDLEVASPESGSASTRWGRP
jgi:hypothetical protein